MWLSKEERYLTNAFTTKEKVYVISQVISESILKGKNRGETDIINTFFFFFPQKSEFSPYWTPEN